MKKIYSVVLFVFIAFLFTISIPFTLYAEEELSRTITATSTHVLGDAGVAIDTSAIKVKGTFGETTLNQTTLTSLSPQVTIGLNSVTVSQKGNYDVTMTYQSVTYALKFFIKDVIDTEYVLYNESFAYPNGALPSELRRFNNVGASGGSAAIDGERLLLSPFTIVLFPAYLQGFTNYVIESDMRMTAANNASRWTSIMYRYATENYYQMAIRQDASAANGVEFAKRSNGGWNVAKTAAFTEALNPATTYQLKVDVKDSTVNQYINDSLLTTYESAFDYKYGFIGVQADNATVYYDNIRITLPVSYVEIERHQFQQVADVYHPSDSIIAPATTLVWFNEASQMEDITSSVRPATAIFRINNDLDIVDEDGTVYQSLYDTLVEIDGLVIPGFYIENQDLAVLVAEELKLFGILDVFVFSKDAESIIAARETHSLIRGVMIFDFTDQEELTVSDLLDVRRETNRAQALAAVLPVDLVSRGQVEYLQQRLMTIWVQAADNDVSQYRAILSGAQGIITQNYENLFAKYELFPANTQVRRPMMIAHRGLYAGALSSAPENTIEAALASVEKGADILELDVYLTSDHEIVIIHDGSTARTAPGYTALTVSSSTLAQLKEINLADPVSGRLDLKIPTLNEYFDALKGSGAVIFIEIKSVDSMLVHLVSLLIEEYDMYDQAVMISFGTQNIIDMNELYPDLSNGLLTSSVLNANSVSSSLTNAISTVVPIKSTLNTSYGALTSEFIKSVIHRGITVWPWTLNDYTELNSYYGYGVNGITTDHIGYYENTFNRINVKEYPSVVTWENRLTVKIQTELEAPNGTTYAYRPEYIMIDDGGTGVVFDEYGKIESIVQPGTIYMYATFDSYLPDGTKITVLTDIIEVEILAEVVEEPSSLGLIIGISSGVLLLAVGTFVFITIKKRRVII
jgi:glycerophosphoryl diester phosphodiesterase